MSNKFPAIPECTTEARSMQATIFALKEAVELLTAQRGTALSAVRWDDLVRLGVIDAQDVPRK